MILTRNFYDAQDLVQETYLRAIPAMKRLQPESNIKSWLFTILRNLWLNQIRQRRNPRKLLEIDADESIADLAIDHANDPHALYVSKVETEQVREAIGQLPVKFREIIVLREYGELSYHEISQVLDCPMGTVNVAVSKRSIETAKIVLPKVGTRCVKQQRVEKILQTTAILGRGQAQ